MAGRLLVARVITLTFSARGGSGRTDPVTEAATQQDAIMRVIDSARHLGVEIDETEAAQWITAMAAEAKGGDIVVDVDTGVFGHRASMLDLDPVDLARFRRIAPIVGFQDRPGVK